MTLFYRLLAFAAVAFAMMAAPQAASAQRTDAKVRVKLVKPLVLTSQQDLEFGTIILGGAVGPQVVTIRPDGTVDCPAPLFCAGSPSAASFNLQGSNRQIVRISAQTSNLTNAATGDIIVFTPIAPASVTLRNSGRRGTDFQVGGSISIPEDAAGDYEGVIELTAEYE